MNYNKIYYQLVQKRLDNPITDKSVKVQVHHIVPRCMDGGDNESNLIRFTEREHYIAHLCLFQMFKNTPVKWLQMRSAVIICKNFRNRFCSANQSHNFRYNKMLYQRIKEYSPCSQKKSNVNILPKETIHQNESQAPSCSSQRIRSKHGNIGRHWYNNGISQVFAKDCPIGWKSGQLKRKR